MARLSLHVCSVVLLGVLFLLVPTAALASASKVITEVRRDAKSAYGRLNGFLGNDMPSVHVSKIAGDPAKVEEEMGDWMMSAMLIARVQRVEGLDRVPEVSDWRELREKMYAPAALKTMHAALDAEAKERLLAAQLEVIKFNESQLVAYRKNLDSALRINRDVDRFTDLLREEALRSGIILDATKMALAPFGEDELALAIIKKAEVNKAGAEPDLERTFKLKSEQQLQKIEFYEKAVEESKTKGTKIRSYYATQISLLSEEFHPERVRRLKASLAAVEGGQGKIDRTPKAPPKKSGTTKRTLDRPVAPMPGSETADRAAPTTDASVEPIGEALPVETLPAYDPKHRDDLLPLEVSQFHQKWLQAKASHDQLVKVAAMEPGEPRTQAAKEVQASLQNRSFRKPNTNTLTIPADAPYRAAEIDRITARMDLLNSWIIAAQLLQGPAEAGTVEILPYSYGGDANSGSLRNEVAGLMTYYKAFEKDTTTTSQVHKSLKELVGLPKTARNENKPTLAITDSMRRWIGTMLATARQAREAVATQVDPSDARRERELAQLDAHVAAYQSWQDAIPLLLAFAPADQVHLAPAPKYEIILAPSGETMGVLAASPPPAAEENTEEVLKKRFEALVEKHERTPKVFITAIYQDVSRGDTLSMYDPIDCTAAVIEVHETNLNDPRLGSDDPLEKLEGRNAVREYEKLASTVDHGYLAKVMNEANYQDALVESRVYDYCRKRIVAAMGNTLPKTRIDELSSCVSKKMYQQLNTVQGNINTMFIDKWFNRFLNECQHGDGDPDPDMHGKPKEPKPAIEEQPDIVKKTEEDAKEKEKTVEEEIEDEIDNVGKEIDRAGKDISKGLKGLFGR